MTVLAGPSGATILTISDEVMETALELFPSEVKPLSLRKKYDLKYLFNFQTLTI